MGDDRRQGQKEVRAVSLFLRTAASVLFSWPTSLLSTTTHPTSSHLACHPTPSRLLFSPLLARACDWISQ